MNVLKELQEANNYVEQNLVELCNELVEYNAAGVLKNGRIRILIRMVSFAESSSQSLALSMIKDAAVKVVAKSI